ncbi:hypothetical protein RCA_01595 [Rickettsia canadensis str. CA410]|uniref:Uncharacterized protein n=1 Tax=Rickettsia canadensis str. CA410 TaxID=1105107 RepID=A0ABM5MTS8_RICCA|nr:hypothetical protein RCA_01595 [Rickettsia canadensis str. CA410]
MNLINIILHRKVDKYKALEFAIQKKNYQQTDDLIELTLM